MKKLLLSILLACSFLAPATPAFAAEKCAVSRVLGLEYQGSTYRLYVEAMCTDVTITVAPYFRVVTAMAESSAFVPALLTPTWSTRVKNAIIPAAYAQWGITVDQVMLMGEIGVLGI